MITKVVAENTAALKQHWIELVSEALSVLGQPQGRRPSSTSYDVFAKVERAKQEWEATADSLCDLICLVDRRGRIIRANKTVEAWHLGAVATVKGTPLHSLVHPGCQDEACYLRAFLSQVEHPTVTRQHAQVEVFDPILQRHILASIRPVLAATKVAPSTVVVVLQDITERKRSEEALQRYTERLEALNQIEQAILMARSPEEVAQAALLRLSRLIPFKQGRVTLLDAETGNFLILAADANGQLHMRPGGLLPQQAFQASEERQPEQFFLVDDLASVSDRSQVEQQLLAEGIRCYLSTPLLANGKFIGSLSLGADHQDAFTAEYIEIVREVADMLAIATRQALLFSCLGKTNVDLQQALSAKNEMIQNVSHELRTPLAITRGYIEMFREGLLGPLSPEQAEAIAVLTMQNERLEYMVNRLLTLQTLDVKTLHKIPVQPMAVVGQIVQAWQPRAAQADIDIRMDAQADLPHIMVDVDLFNQVLYNLLDNAVKYSPDGGMITVRIGSKQEELIIAVADQGIGLAPEVQEQVFERFFRVENGLCQSSNGLGIGLTLCHKIIQIHDGRMWCESAGIGKGSTFYVALPIGEN